MKTIILSIGTDESRNIRVRLSLCSDGFRHFHSIPIRPGDNLEEARKSVEAHISMPYEFSGIPGAPWPKIPDAEWNEVLAIVNTLHTPERIAKRRENDRKNQLTLMADTAP